MVPFLTEVAQHLLNKFGNDLDKVTVVFNNRRSGLFLRHRFLELSDKPLFLPRTIGMDVLINELSGLEIVQNELLLFELFDVHRHLLGNDGKFITFEEFIPFGDMMLADFSEVDLYCVDTKQLFTNIHEIKAIGEWDIETGTLTPFQEKYLLFYRSLYQYYSELHQRLLSKNKAYSGMAYRTVSENISTLCQRFHGQHLCFVGFNALSTSEERIIHTLVTEGVASLYTDGDPYYFADDHQEAGYFLRKNQPLFPEIGSYHDHYGTGNKTISIVSCSENVLQCKYAGNIIQSSLLNSQHETLNDTAIVLADETLLLPMLNALPEQVKAANVTMGFPFTNTGVHSLMLKLFSLHCRRREQTFYHQDILDILSDPIVSKLLGTSNIHSKINALFFQEHVIYTDTDTLSDLCKQISVDISPIRFLLSDNPPSVDDFLSMTHQLIQLIYNAETLKTNLKEMEALACLLEIVDHFQDIQNEYHFIETLSILQKIYNRLAQRRSVAFYGEPLAGLQILGVLETRNLDFKRLIILSVNEGTIPSARSFNSLIPYNLKTAFGLPTFHEKDAVYAYNFYRLLQRAEEIHLIYSTESDLSGKGDPSRFIHQIRRELVERFPQNISIKEEIVSATNCLPEVAYKNRCDKTETVMSRIQEIAARGLSPSALNKYRACPLKFYYENVLGINESEQLTEDLEQNELGSCIHAVLEHIFSLDADRHVRIETLQSALNQLDSIIDQILSSQFHHGRNVLGRNHFLKSVAKTQITNFLKSEIKYLQTEGGIDILGLEQQLSHSLEIPSGNNIQQVVISGIADRIDISNKTIRIIDYKSGKVDPRELHVSDPEPDWAAVSDKWFQLMTYEWLYAHSQTTDLPHISGIFPLRHLNSQLLTASWEGSDIITPHHLETFDQMLRQLVSELFNTDIPFLPNPQSKMCGFCPFSEICQRIPS